MTKKPRKKSSRKPPPRFPYDPETSTVAAARQWVTDNAVKPVGVVCPCCDKFAKIYKNKLYYVQAYALILLVRETKKRAPGEWIHLPDLLTEKCPGPISRGGDPAKLVHWTLIESPNDEMRADESWRTGLYRVKPLGFDFAAGRVRVPKYVLLYGGKFLGYVDETETISIQEALDEHFNYAELMGS